MKKKKNFQKDTQRTDLLCLAPTKKQRRDLEEFLQNRTNLDLPI